ncbi:class I adenylate-forming enzyme family protein [Cumulibacter manganitolerans]|uniref:class I adenylate-forming enzyme family protein n=1 Tax=Cumulibacter manganitolerans TaxID=1884992 RepID=UPI0012962B34|nr:class I adenylate-forming enzyme family protein [Cumulibacter manganitolerans]
MVQDPAGGTTALSPREEAVARLTAPGADFEITEREVRGIPMRVFTAGPQTLRDVFLQTRQYGDLPFLIYENERVSFAEHAALVAGLATRLRDDYGLRKGDRLGIAMRNYPEWVPVFFAAQVLGVIVVPFNAWWTAEELRYAVADSTPSLVVADGERAALMVPICAELGQVPVVAVRVAEPVAGTIAWEELTGGLDPAAALPEAQIDPDDDATILYTSGTTGRPKGAIGTHRNHCTNLLNTQLGRAVTMAMQPQPVALPTTQPGTLCPFPLFHIAGMSTMIATASGGSKLVLMYKWDVAVARRHIKDEQLTAVAAVPTIVKELVEDEGGDPGDLASLVGLASGGAAVPHDLITRIETQFQRKVSPANGYGLTETTSAIVSNSGQDYFDHPDSVGRPQPGADLLVVGPDGEPVPEGEVGELWFRGPNVVRGYWNNPDATAAAFEGGWFRTGDLGKYVDGFVYVVDRLKDVIIRGGENIYCVEVENALFEHPSVLDVALVGVPDDQLGEVAVAVVVPRPGARVSEPELQDHVAGQLARFKVPAAVIIRDEPLPRTATGKALKRQLRTEVLDQKGA